MSEVVRDGLRGVMAARAGGVLPAARRAAKWIEEELTRTPMRLGESRDFLPGLQLRRRFAVIRPLTVWFAVHEESKNVFVLEFGPTGL